jgi:tRNA(fMet)-specific endonuclease VapC
MTSRTPCCAGANASWSNAHERLLDFGHGCGELPVQEQPARQTVSPLLKGKRPALAFVSIAELYTWTLKRGWGPEQVEQLEAALHPYIVIPYDRDMAWSWARVVAACEDAGRPIAASDAWIAATALRHDVPLLTNNLKHYEAAETLCGLQLLRAQST